MPRQTSIQLTEATDRQVAALKTAGYGSLTDIIRIAIDRMYQQETRTMNSTNDTYYIDEQMLGNTATAADARRIAVEAVEYADGDGYPVADTTVVGIDDNGYWVADNGEAVNGLTKDQAIEIIVENLTA